jgi:hypothetical protein
MVYGILVVTGVILASLERLPGLRYRQAPFLRALFASDVFWGVVDGGGLIPVATRPSVGRRAVARRFANALRRLGTATIACSVRRLNGEPAVLVTLPDLGGGRRSRPSILRPATEQSRRFASSAIR